MKLHEYQAKEIFRQRGIRVPAGEVASSADEARAVAKKLAADGATRFAVKSQVHAGGRGKGGGIKLVDSPDAVAEAAKAMLGMPLVTPQTGPEGVTVRRVLIEAGVDIASELYLGITLDRSAERAVIISSASGGMEIEEVAARDPEAILREHVMPGWGIRPFQARRVVRGLGVEGPAARGIGDVIVKLANIFKHLDGGLVEINPLVITGAGEVVALDAKMSIDDHALFRHRDLAELRDVAEEQPLELEAAKHDLSYVALDGTIGCMVNGAGLAMATMDEIANAGGFPANFLDVGGGASVDRVASAFEILMKAPSVRAVLVNIFGGIVRCDRVAQGVIKALESVQVDVPMVVRLQGTNAAEGAEILRSADHKFIVADTLREAAERAVAAAGESVA